MNQFGVVDDANVKEAKLPRRDWILLPMVGLLTISLLAGSTELIARWIFPKINSSAEDCLTSTDPVTGPRGVPNSVCWEKFPEGELTRYQFNSCGHLTGMECGPKPPGTYRIVMLGTSFAAGMRVPREKSFGALLPKELSERTGMKVELYNEAVPWAYPEVLASHFRQVLLAQPDMILYAVNPNDLGRSQKWMPDALRHLSFRVRVWRYAKGLFANKSIAFTLSNLFSHTRTATLLSHILWSSPSQFSKSYLMKDDDVMGYLRIEPSVLWQNRLHEFNIDIAKLTTQANEAGIPFVVVLLPNHAQAAMISLGEWPAGYDPYKLDKDLRTIVTSNGGTFIDILTDIRTVPDLQYGYFPVEGHPDANGHAIVSRLLAKQLTNGSVPALKVVSQTQAGLEQER